MTVAGQNFEIYQGDNKQIVITIFNSSGGLQDLTGYNALWCMFQQPSENVVLLKSTGVAGGATIPNPTNGEIVIELSSEDTENMIPKIYGHQCEIEDLSGNHATTTTGYVKIVKSLTHTNF